MEGFHAAGRVSGAGFKPVFPNNPSTILPSGSNFQMNFSVNRVDESIWSVPCIYDSGYMHFPERHWSSTQFEYKPYAYFTQIQTEELVRHPSYNSGVKHKIQYWIGWSTEYVYKKPLYINHKVPQVKQGYYPESDTRPKAIDYRYQPPFSSKIAIGGISYSAGYPGPAIYNPGVMWMDNYPSYDYMDAVEYYGSTGEVAVAFRNAIDPFSIYSQTKTVEFLKLRFILQCDYPKGYVSTGPNSGYATSTLPYKVRLKVFLSDHLYYYAPYQIKSYATTEELTINRVIGASVTFSPIRLTVYNAVTGVSDSIYLNNVTFRIVELIYEDPAFSPYFGNP